MDQGTHDELLAFGGIYEKMWNLQRKKEIQDKATLMTTLYMA